jgi:hypothetical protein
MLVCAHDCSCFATHPWWCFDAKCDHDAVITTATVVTGDIAHTHTHSVSTVASSFRKSHPTTPTTLLQVSRNPPRPFALHLLSVHATDPSIPALHQHFHCLSTTRSGTLRNGNFLNLSQQNSPTLPFTAPRNILNLRKGHANNFVPVRENLLPRGFAAPSTFQSPQTKMHTTRKGSIGTHDRIITEL